METYFDHERLKVYQEAISFIAWCAAIERKGTAGGAIRDQLGRAASSIALNLAEGNGKTAPKDRCRFFEIARGSALECAAALDVFSVLGSISPEELQEGKRRLVQVVSMIIGLIRAVERRGDVAYEDELAYDAGVGLEQEQD